MAVPDWKALIGAKTYDEIWSGVEARWAALVQADGGSITNMNVGGKFRSLLELAVEAASACHDLFVAIVPNGFRRYATGAWLDLRLADVGTERLAAAKTRWYLTVARAGTAGNVVIPDASEYRTRTTLTGDVLRFRQVGAVVLPDGESSVKVLAEALDVGSRYNVAPGAICEFVTVIPGVTSVTNPAEDLVRAGRDVEEDEDAQVRSDGRWPALSRGFPAEAYEGWAKEISGVVDVAVLDEHPRGQGTVDVVITGATGAPGTELVDQVTALLKSRMPQCLADLVLVRGPVTRSAQVRLVGVLPLDRGDVATTEARLVAVVQSMLFTGELADVPRLRIGKDLRRGRLVKACMSADEDLLDVEIELPAANVVVAGDELVVLDGEPEVSVVRREE